MVTDQRVCNNSGMDKKISSSQKIGPLLSINGIPNENIGITERVKQYCSSYRTYYPCCIGGGKEELTVTRNILSMPKYIFIVLDYSFEALCKFHDYQEFIALNYQQYSIFAAITKLSSANFALILRDPIDPISIKLVKGWLQYDDLLNEGNLTAVNESVKELLCKHDAYILLYENYEL